jgi:transposase
MGNVLDDTEQQRIWTLGRLGWTLLRIQRATGVRRETVSAYLKAAGIPVRGRGRPREETAKPAIPGEEVSTDSPPRPWPPAASRAPQTSACEAYRDRIEAALRVGRNAMGIW